MNFDNKIGLEERLTELAKHVVSATDLELYDVEFNSSQSKLTVFIFDPKTGTALIEDCVTVDRAFTDPMNDLPWVPENIRLEVSSPGVFRKLRTPAHFQSCVGEKVKVVVNKTFDFGKADRKPLALSNPIEGLVEKVETDQVVLNIENEHLAIKFSEIKKANLSPEF